MSLASPIPAGQVNVDVWDSFMAFPLPLALLGPEGRPELVNSRFLERFDAGKASLGAMVEFLAQDVVARHLMTVDRAFFPLFEKAQ